MCNNRPIEARLEQRRRKITMKNPTLELVRMTHNDYRLVLKDEDQSVKFEVMNRPEAEHFITQSVYDLNHTTNDTCAGKEVAVGSGLVQLSKTATYFIPTNTFDFLNKCGFANKALELIDAIEEDD